MWNLKKLACSDSTSPRVNLSCSKCCCHFNYLPVHFAVSSLLSPLCSTTLAQLLFLFPRHLFLLLSFLNALFFGQYKPSLGGLELMAFPCSTIVGVCWWAGIPENVFSHLLHEQWEERHRLLTKHIEYRTVNTSIKDNNGYSSFNELWSLFPGLEINLWK